MAKNTNNNAIVYKGTQKYQLFNCYCNYLIYIPEFAKSKYYAVARSDGKGHKQYNY